MYRRNLAVKPMTLILVCLLPILITGLLPGCALVAPTPDPVTITFAHPQSDTGYYETLVELFQDEYPYITVELEPQISYDFGWINVDDADVFVHTQFALGELLADDQVLDLTPFIDKDKGFQPDDFYPGTLAMYSRDGKTWGVPAGADVMVMYYNQELFDTYGVGYPQIDWTWDDFLGIASQVNEPDIAVFGYGPNYELFDPLLFIYQGGGGIFDDLQNPIRTTFDDPANIEALDWFTNLIYDYNVAPSPEQVRDAYSSLGGLTGAIVGGKIGMWTGMLSDRGGQTYSAPWPMRWGVVNLPKGVQSATLTTISAYFISSQAEDPDACWAWLSFVSQQTPQRQTPVRRSQLESTEYEQQIGGDIATAARASMNNSMLLSPRLAEFEQALGIFQQAMDAIVTLRATPEEALIQAQNLADR